MQKGDFLNRSYIKYAALLLCLCIVALKFSVLLDTLFFIRIQIYEQPVLVLAILLVYIITGTILSYKNRKILPFFLTGLILFVTIYNLFASYQEVLKFGVSQRVFTGLFKILIHSPVLPLILVSGISIPALIGIGAIGLIILKGFIITRKFFKSSYTEQILLTFGFGFGITAFLMFILAALHLLTIRNVLLVDIALFSIIFLAPSKKFDIEPIPLELTHTEKKVWTGIGVILFIVFLYAAILPPLEWDSLAYQAYYSKLIYEHKGLPVIYGPSIGIEMSAAYPPAYQVIGSYIFVLSGDTIIQLMNILSYISGVLSVIVVFLFATITIKSHRMYAVTASVAVPFFMAFAASPHYLTLLIFFNGLFLLYLTRYILGKPVHYIGIAAIFLGCACLTSYLGFASFLFLVIVYLKKKFPLSIVAIPACIAVPPLIRNFWYTGNPLFPLLGIGHQLQNQLWASNTAHFRVQAVYAGLKITSPFSVLDFTMNRISSIRPLLPLILVVGILFLLFVRPKSPEKKWLTLFFVGSVFIFFVRPTFDRYLLIYLPVYSSFFAWIIYKSEKLEFHIVKYSLQFTVIASLAILILGISITGPLMVASHIKQFPEQPLDQWAYVRQFYPHDTPCWQWLNDNTTGLVATYDIRFYYVDKDMMPLDGLEALPVYEMSYTEALEYLEQKNVTHWFSSRWTSPADETCPPAYYDNPLMPYLGSDILPMVFVSGQSAVYHLGRKYINYQDLLETEQVLYPVHEYEYSFDTGRMVYFDIPGDFHEKKITLVFSHSVKGGVYYGHAVSVDLLGGSAQKIEGSTLIFDEGSGKYTLYIVSDTPFTITVLIE
ncbi:MAG: hypothetical protein PVF58_21785 [Candidatus Methanofastidiosia archaeon]